MTKIAIVLRNSRRGELYRREFTVQPDQSESAVIGNALVAAIEDSWHRAMSPGNSITIQAIKPAPAYARGRIAVGD